MVIERKLISLTFKEKDTRRRKHEEQVAESAPILIRWAVGFRGDRAIGLVRANTVYERLIKRTTLKPPTNLTSSLQFIVVVPTP